MIVAIPMVVCQTRCELLFTGVVCHCNERESEPCNRDTSEQRLCLCYQRILNNTHFQVEVDHLRGLGAVNARLK